MLSKKYPYRDAGLQSGTVIDVLPPKNCAPNGHKCPISVSARNVVKLKRQKAKFYHDCSSCNLPEVEIGQDITVVPLQKNHLWKRSTCVEKLP